MDSDNCTTCYKGIQRVYRNAMAGYIGATLRARYGEQYSAQLRLPFQKEWDRLMAAARETRDQGLVTTPILADIDLLGVNHFFNLVDVHFDALLPGLPAQAKTQVLSFLREIKAVRDPLSHPGEPDLAHDDAWRQLDNAQRVLEIFALHEPALEIRGLKGMLEGGMNGTAQPPTREPLAGRLPSAESVVALFVGRRTELEHLWQWLKSAGNKVWTLAGEGGKGKSALAYEFAQQVREEAPHPLTAVIWLSAKRQRFLEGQVVVVDEPDFHDLPSALSSILAGYGGLHRLEESVTGLEGLALEFLNDFPALIIMDDIDSLEEANENAIRFFAFDVPNKTASRVLFTSRRTVFGLADVTTHIEGLDTADAAAFIQSRVDKYELDGNLFVPGVIREMTKVTEGSPLFLEDLLRLALVTSPREAIHKWREKGGAEARKYALGRELDLLPRFAREVLVAAAVVPGSVSGAELQAITSHSEDAVITGLKELQKLFLVPRPRLIEGEPRFELNENTRALVRQVEGSSQLFRRFENATRALAGKLSQAGAPNIVQCIRQAMALLQASRHESAEATLLKGLDDAPDHPDLLDFLGRVYRSWMPPRYTDARERFRRAAALRCANEEMYLRWTQMEIERREWTVGIEAAKAGLQRIPSSRILKQQAGYCHSILGQELIRTLQEERGRQELAEARGYLETALVEKQESGTKGIPVSRVYRSLVITCEWQGDRSAVQAYLARWERECPGDEKCLFERERLNRKLHLT